jgi:ribosomal protein S12 methylthiotransferase accessory factor
MSRLSQLSQAELAELNEDLASINASDERPLWEILGLAIPAGTAWKELRMGEIKTLVALALGDLDAVLDGCQWLRMYQQMNPARLAVYQCLENIIKLEDTAPYLAALELMYGQATVHTAQNALGKINVFFGLTDLGPNFEFSEMHQGLLAAYDKLFK